MMNLILKLLNIILSIFKKKPQIEPIIPPAPIIPPEPQKPPETPPSPQNTPSTAWAAYPDDQKDQLRVMVYKKCVAANLTQNQILNLFGTIEGESGFNPNCVHANGDTTDFGLCQLNSYWYLDPNNMTGQQAIDNPDKCVDIMIRSWQAGRQNDWIAYRSGGYLGFIYKDTGQLTPEGVKHTGPSVENYLPNIKAKVANSANS